MQESLLPAGQEVSPLFRICVWPSMTQDFSASSCISMQQLVPILSTGLHGPAVMMQQLTVV